MKKMLLATASFRLLQDVLNRSLTVQNKPAAGTKGNHHPLSSFLELGRRKLSMQPKFVAAQKMLLKQKPQQTFVNGLLGFITLGIYTRWKRVYCSQMSCPSIWATLSALLINMFALPVVFA